MRKGGGGGEGDRIRELRRGFSSSKNHHCLDRKLNRKMEKTLLGIGGEVKNYWLKREKERGRRQAASNLWARCVTCGVAVDGGNESEREKGLRGKTRQVFPFLS